MALLHAGPFSWADEAIRFGRFSEFVDFIIEQDQEKKMMEIWLHKVFNLGYEDWKSQVRPKPKPTQRQIEATVQNSVAVANIIIPPTES